MIFTDLFGRLTSLRKLRTRMINEMNADLRDISSRDFMVLDKVCRSPGGLSMSDISESTGLSNALITGAVDNLEKIGLVRRTTGTDRRSYIIRSTKNGESRHKDAERKLETSIESFLGGMERQDMDDFLDLLEKLDNLLKKYT